MYNYETEKPQLFTDAGQRMFLQIRDRVNELLSQAGAVRLQEAIAHSSGDSWLQAACLDRMVELKEIREIQQTQPVAGQHRIFVKVGG